MTFRSSRGAVVGTSINSSLDQAGASGSPAIELQDVTFSYGSVQVLFGVSVSVPIGGVVALLGSNGAGKSTILQLIAGTLRPSSGSVWVGGDDVSGGDVSDRVRRGLVLVPEIRGIFPELSVEDNLQVGAYMLRKDRRLRAERLDEVLTLFPVLGKRRKQHASTLSGGERQMLALAKVFQLHPSTMLIDELSLGLAPTVVDSLVESVGVFKDRGMSLLIVEQSINVAAVLAEHAIFIEKGSVQFEGSMKALHEDQHLMQSVLLGGHAGGTN
uniref:Unannotated protein n=1 Tax=freshwater metagenome TaxID=449393 RepID=A0A6J7MCY0_9ZZZZ